MLILYAFTYFSFTFFHNSLPDDDDGDDDEGDDDGPYHTGSVCSYCELCEVRF